TCTRSPTARGSAHASHYAMGDVAFSSTERDRHLGIRPVSQLNTWPVVSPVNASRRPSRDAAHHSGSGWLARPSPWGTFTSYSLPAFLAHSESGHKLPRCKKNWVKARHTAPTAIGCRSRRMRSLMLRREFIAGLGSAAAWPAVARAQQVAVPVVGVRLTQSADDYKIEIAAFLQSLKEAGYVEGQNVAVEYRWAENQ